MGKRLIMGLGLNLLLWGFLSVLIQAYYFPTPWAAGKAMWEDGATLWHQWGISMMRLAWAVLGSSILGLSLGIWISLSKWSQHWLIPLVESWYPVPRIVLLPIFLASLGLGDVSKIAIMMAISVFYFLVPIYGAVLRIPSNYWAVAKSLNFSDYQVIRYLILPAVLPEIITAFKLTVGTCLAALFTAENISSTSGIGFYIMNAWGFGQFDRMFGGIVLIALTGIGAFSGIQWIEQRHLPWIHSSDDLS